MTDAFGVRAVRERVLAGWTASPARFREDANAEEDFALGGYRDRVIIELAQNAADAATRAGVPGRVRFALSGTTLVVANTGAPLTAAGVESLATLRASAKRDDESAVGRFGVGFAAVLAVTDEPAVLSRTGGVRFSRADTAAVVGGVRELDEEVRRREGHVPALRLPFEADGEPPEGFDTAVLLPLRDGSAVEFVRRLLDEAGDALLLALPGLDRIEIDVEGNERVLADAASRWHVHRVGGVLDARDVVDRPVEERARPYWSVVWALPRDPDIEVPRTVHAPTPTDEPLSLPALLLATFPLDPTRRHVASGPLTERLVAEASKAYADLLHTRAVSGADVLPLVPTGLAAGVLDARIREAILTVLPGVPLLAPVASAPSTAEEEGWLVRGRDAVVVEGADERFEVVMAQVVGGLVRGWGNRAALDALGVRRVELADLVDELAALERSPDWWRHMYESLTGMVQDPLTRESLGALPVPLADGRLVRGARGVLLPGEGLGAEALSVFGQFGVRVIHPEAAHETLERLGAVPTTPATLLADGAVRAAVEHEADVADAVLSIVEAAGPVDLWWLGDLMLRDADGEPAPAHALVLRGSDAEALFDPDDVAPVDPALLERYGAAVLESVGVLRTLRVVQGTGEFADIDGMDEWAQEIAGTVGELSAVRDLDWVADWPRALEVLASDPVLRSALVDPVRVIETGESVPSYTSWWIRRHAGLSGHADPGADPVLADLLDPAPSWTERLDQDVRRAIGLVHQVGDLDVSGVELLLDRLADPERVVDTDAMLRLWSALGSCEGSPPSRVRVLDGSGGTWVVDADDAVVVDAPMWLQRPDIGGFVVASGQAADGLSDLLDLPLANEVAAGKVEGESELVPVPDIVRRSVPEVPDTWWEHEELHVDGVEVSWWVTPDGSPHASTVDGLAKALAWSAGRWDRRHLILALLNDPDADLLVDTAFDI